jgi:hypothetical protein
MDTHRGGLLSARVSPGGIAPVERSKKTVPQSSLRPRESLEHRLEYLGAGEGVPRAYRARAATLPGEWNAPRAGKGGGPAVGGNECKLAHITGCVLGEKPVECSIGRVLAGGEGIDQGVRKGRVSDRLGSDRCDPGTDVWHERADCNVT